MSRPGVTAFAVLIAAVFLFGSASAAFAHEGEQDVPALTLVQEAIAIIRSQPELMDNAADKIKDALDSTDPTAVDLGKVQQAEKTLEAADLAQTELLLEQAIGACPGAPVVTPAGIRTPPITSPCPKPSHLTALNRVPVRGAARTVLLSLAVVAIAGGLLVARRAR